MAPHRLGYSGGNIGGTSVCLRAPMFPPRPSGVIAMARKAANPTLVMLVQQIKPECWSTRLIRCSPACWTGARSERSPEG